MTLDKLQNLFEALVLICKVGTDVNTYLRFEYGRHKPWLLPTPVSHNITIIF